MNDNTASENSNTNTEALATPIEASPVDFFEIDPTPPRASIEDAAHVAGQSVINQIQASQLPQIAITPLQDHQPIAPPVPAPAAPQASDNIGEAVIKLRAPKPDDPVGSFFREDGRLVSAVAFAKASFAFYLSDDRTAVIVKNLCGRTTGKVRPTAASKFAAKAHYLHGKNADELKERVKQTARRTGPPATLAQYNEMLAALVLFPGIFRELGLTDEQLDQLIKLVNNTIFSHGLKIHGPNIGFQVPTAEMAKVQFCTEAKLPWVWVGNRTPEEVCGLALLRLLTNLRDQRHHGAT